VLRPAGFPFIFATDFRNMQDPMFTGLPAMSQNLPVSRHVVIRPADRTKSLSIWQAFPNEFVGAGPEHQTGALEFPPPLLVRSDPCGQRAGLDVVDHGFVFFIDREAPVIPEVAFRDLPEFMGAGARYGVGVAERRLSSWLHYLSGDSPRFIVGEAAKRMLSIRVQHVPINQQLKS